VESLCLMPTISANNCYMLLVKSLSLSDIILSGVP
jgi:hypothetical protein